MYKAMLIDSEDIQNEFSSVENIKKSEVINRDGKIETVGDPLERISPGKSFIHPCSKSVEMGFVSLHSWSSIGIGYAKNNHGELDDGVIVRAPSPPMHGADSLGNSNLKR